MKARIYELHAPRSLALADSVVESPGQEEIVAQTLFTVISPGTEVAAWTGKPPLRPGPVYPRLLGYCNMARVVKVGEAITDIAPGDCILTHQSHRTAFKCLRSEVLLTRPAGSTAELEALTATYLFHLGYASLLKGCFEPGHEVAVVGLGALGYCTANLLSCLRTNPLLVTGRSTEGMSLPSGAEVLRKQSFESWNPGDLGGVDIVVNTSDAWEDYLRCLQLARKGGTVVLLGFPGRGQPTPLFNPLDSEYLYDKQLTITQYVPEVEVAEIVDNMSYLARLIESGELPTEELLGFRVRWQDLDSAYQRLEERRPGDLSTILEWTT